MAVQYDTTSRGAASEPNRAAEPSLSQLVTGLTTDLSDLMRKEIALAKTETKENALKMAMGAGLLAAGGLVAYAGLMLLLIALAVFLGNALNNPGLAFLIVSVVTLIVGAVLFFVGRGRMNEANLAPQKTIDSLSDTTEMVKEKLS